MGVAIVIAIILIISGLIAWRLVKGIDYMDKHHKGYNGDDFFGGHEE
jgi:hypothetical protein